MKCVKHRDHPRSKDSAKERILLSAKKEFSERGFSGARMSSIAKGASVNKALIHYYFKDKETLYLDVLTRIFRGTESAFTFPGHIGRWKLTPSQKLYVIIYFTVNILLKATDPDAMRIIFWELAEGERRLDRLMMEYTIPRQKMVVDVVKEGMEKGEFETGYPMMAAMNIVSFISLFSINRDIYGGKPVFSEMYGDVNDEDVFRFVLEQAFKFLKPKNKRMTLPTLPPKMEAILEDMLEILIRKKDEGVNEELFRRVDEILHDQL